MKTYNKELNNEAEELRDNNSKKLNFAKNWIDYIMFGTEGNKYGMKVKIGDNNNF